MSGVESLPKGGVQRGRRGVSLRVGIIGAGLSGRLLAINLLRLAERGQRIEILLFDTRDERSVGPAYSDQADYLLLNVPLVA